MTNFIIINHDDVVDNAMYQLKTGNPNFERSKRTCKENELEEIDARK